MNKMITKLEKCVNVYISDLRGSFIRFCKKAINNIGSLICFHYLER